MTHTNFCLIPGGGAKELICFTQNTPLHESFFSFWAIYLICALFWNGYFDGGSLWLKCEYDMNNDTIHGNIRSGEAPIESFLWRRYL